MARSMATEPRRMPTAQGVSLVLDSLPLIYSLTRLILLFLSYVGAFENGECHGQGIHTLACGRVFTGVFTHNKLHGEVMVTNTDGSRYFFPFKDHIPSINLYYAFNFFF